MALAAAVVAEAPFPRRMALLVVRAAHMAAVAAEEAADDSLQVQALRELVVPAETALLS